MSLRHALLGLLADRPYTGWQLLKHFEGSLAYAWPALHSQIYPELGRLREQGLIEQTGEGPRGAKEYALTPAGLEEVTRWLREMPPGRGVRNEALLRVYFLWLLDADEAASYLEREAAYQRELLAELERIAAVEEPVTAKERAYRLALDYGLRDVRARLDWAEAAVAYIRSPAWREAPRGSAQPLPDAASSPS
jgi:PadR family transcriptional regulator, regulatory protein AphA